MNITIVRSESGVWHITQARAPFTGANVTVGCGAFIKVHDWKLIATWTDAPPFANEMCKTCLRRVNIMVAKMRNAGWIKEAPQ